MKTDHPCVTHHFACDCREKRVRETLVAVCRELLATGKNGNEAAFTAYVELNEMWLELYGSEVLDEQRNR